MRASSLSSGVREWSLRRPSSQDGTGDVKRGGLNTPGTMDLKPSAISNASKGDLEDSTGSTSRPLRGLKAVMDARNAPGEAGDGAMLLGVS